MDLIKVLPKLGWVEGSVLISIKSETNCVENRATRCGCDCKGDVVSSFKPGQGDRVQRQEKVGLDKVFFVALLSVVFAEEAIIAETNNLVCVGGWLV